ncbi:winged helix-turn-helix transcriptional regulator [Aquimarina sp. U1-2]|nr:winged helix-turn-helix transcriptional regulator [Aquimarina sp. U1-2]
MKRKVYDQTPVLIEYELTESGKNMSTLIDHLIDWGMRHRELTIIKSID